MKQNKKGFTLIELLAVVVILLAISVIAISSISAAIERNKEKQNKTKQQVIVSLTKLYYNSNKNSMEPTDCINVSALRNTYKILSDEESKDMDGNTFTGYVKYTNGDNFEYVPNCS